jgi:hypothetical protein
VKICLGTAMKQATLESYIPRKSDCEVSIDLQSSDIEAQSSDQFRVPSFSPLRSPQASARDLTLAHTYQEGLAAHLHRATHTLSLATNEFYSLYQAVLEDETGLAQKYRYVYHILSKYESKSEDILVQMCEQLAACEHIKGDVVYLLGLLRSRKALKLLEARMPRSVLLTLQLETFNSKLNVNIGNNRLPVRYINKRQNSDGKTALTKTTFSQTMVLPRHILRQQLEKTQPLHLHSNPNHGSRKDIPNKVIHVQHLGVQQPGHYFRINC